MSAVAGFEDFRVARAGLLRVCEPPAAAVQVFVSQVGAVAAFERIAARTAPAGVLAATRARTVDKSMADLLALAEFDLQQALAVGARLVCPEDAAWPAAAMSAFDVALAKDVEGAAPPLALYVKGELGAVFPYRAVTIVGSRASSSYGERVASEIASGVGQRGLVIVSGGAFGIDTMAHRAALAVDAVSVAVLACGIDRSYPVANAALLGRVAATGAVVSEYPPGTTPARHRFLVRNRLIAALGAVTVVVEAGRRSGSLSTAAAALHLSRVVMAVPGPVTSAMSAGCHLLLRDRARGVILATGALDVLQELESAECPALFDDGAPGDVRLTDGLDPVAARVYDAIPARGGISVQGICESSAVPSNQVLAALPMLQVSGLVSRDGPFWKLGGRAG